MQTILRISLLFSLLAIACAQVSAQSRIFYSGDEVTQFTGHVDIPETLLSSSPGILERSQTLMGQSSPTKVTISQVRSLATTWGAVRFTLVGRGDIRVTAGHLIRLDSTEAFTESGLASPGQSITDGVWMNPTENTVFLEVQGGVMKLAPDAVFGVVELASMCLGCDITCRDGWKACCNYGVNGSPSTCDCVRINGGQNECDVGGQDGAVSCAIDCPNSQGGGGGGESQPLLPD